MNNVFVAAGSNIEPQKNLSIALAEVRRSWPDARFSAAYQNSAEGFVGADFVNLVVGFVTSQTLAQVLAQLHAIETLCGRPRDAQKWAPRSMDLDVLLFGDLVGEFPGARLPRPDLLKRAYMLGPMAELAPLLRHPTAGKTIAELWAAFDRAAHPLRPVGLTLPAAC